MGKVPWTIVCSVAGGPNKAGIKVLQALCSADIPKEATHALLTEPPNKSSLPEVTWLIDPENRLVAPADTKLSILVALRGEHAMNMRVLEGVEVYSV